MKRHRWHYAESLEMRRLLATINGTGGDDVIDVMIQNGSIIASVNGATSSFADASNTTIIVNASGGNDTIKIHQTGDNATTINGGAGNDTLTAGNASWYADISRATFKFVPDTGTDRVNVSDYGFSSQPGGQTQYIIDTSTLRSTVAANPVEYGDAEEVFFQTSATNSRVAVQNLPAYRSVTVVGGQGQDYMDVPGSAYAVANRFLGSLNFQGGGNSNFVEIGDGPPRANAPGVDFRIANDSASVTSLPFGVFTFAQVSSVYVTGNTGPDSVTLGNVGGLVKVIANLGDGDDSFRNSVPDIASFGATDVSLNGGAGKDSWFLDDSAATTRTTYLEYRYSYLQASRSPLSARVDYDAIENLVVTEGAGITSVVIEDLDNDVSSFSLDAGGDNDQLALNCTGPEYANVQFSLNGGSGDDSLAVKDSDTGLTSRRYVIGTTVLDKYATPATQPFSIDHFNLESINLSNTAAGSTFEVTGVQANLVLTGSGTFDLHSGHSQGGPGLATINGGSGNDTVIAGSDDSMGGVFHPGGGDDVLRYDDSAGTLAATGAISIGSAGINRAGNPLLAFDAGALEQLVYTDGSNGHIIEIAATIAAATTINGGGGNDEFIVGGHDLVLNINRPLVINGDAGSDSVTISDDLDTPGGDTMSFGGGGALPLAVTKNETTYTFNSIESRLTVNGSPQATTYSTAALAISLTINGGDAPDSFYIGTNRASVAATAGAISGSVRVNANGGNDLIQIGAGDLDTFKSVSVTVNAGEGDDTVSLRDDNDAGPANNYAVTEAGVAKSGGATGFVGLTIQSRTVELIVLSANNNANSISVRIAPPGGFSLAQVQARIEANSGADVVTVYDGDVTVNGGAGLDNVTATIDTTGVPHVVFDVEEDLNVLTIDSGATVAVTAGIKSTLTLNTLSLTGTLQLNDGALVATNNTLSQISAWLSRGYKNVTPKPGAGVIVSATAAGTALNDALGFARIGTAADELDISSFRGKPVTAGNIVVRYTLSGDANLDGTINFDDLIPLAQNYNKVGETWRQGDFTFDGTVNFDDLIPLAQNYNASLLNVATVTSPVAVKIPVAPTKREPALRPIVI